MSSDTQGGASSLVLGKNNCNNSVESSTPESGVSDSTEQTELGDHCDLTGDDDLEGRYDCRRVYSNFRFEEESAGDDEETSVAPFRCGQWDCYCCGYKMRMNLVEEVQRVARERPAMRRFITLTLDPSKLPDGEETGDKERCDYLMETWRKLRTYVEREYGDFSFIWVKENGEENPEHWHLHVLISRYLDQSWLSEAWSAIGGGEVVDIRYVNRLDKVGHYLGKYLTKNALSEFPDGVQRYGCSEDIDLDVRSGGESESEWDLLMEDMAVETSDGDWLTREVAPADFVLQRRWDGPVPPD